MVNYFLLLLLIFLRHFMVQDLVVIHPPCFNCFGSNVALIITLASVTPITIATIIPSIDVTKHDELVKIFFWVILRLLPLNEI